MRDGRLRRGANGPTHSARSSSSRSASIAKHAPAPSIATDREKLARADVGSRARTLLELQRAGGNAAVTERVAIGHHAVSRTLVQPEPTLQRQKAAPKSRLRKTAFDRTALETIKANAETRHERITDFIARSRAKLQYYKTRLLNAAVVYKAAFNRHKAVLDSAETAAKDRAQLISTIAGFATGVVLGVPGAVARIGLARLAERSAAAFAIGSEVAELIVGKVGGSPDPGAFDPTAETPELKELAVWRTIAEMSDKLLSVSLLTAKLMKIVSASGTAITEVRLREGGAQNLEKSDSELHTLVGALQKADEASAQVDAALEAATAEIDQLGANPPRSMSVEEVEQDIWIEWIADLTDDDLLDENEITDHLEAIGVIGEGRVYWSEEDGYTREPPRLDVDFGAWVSDEDEEDAVRAARAKLGRLPPVPASEYYEEE